MIIEETVRIDDRGRIVIPGSVRKVLRLAPGAELLMQCDDELNQIILAPFFGKDTQPIKIRVLMSDVQGAMAKIATVVGNMGINLLQNEARIVTKGSTAEWISVADISKMKNALSLDQVKARILESDAAIEVDIEKY